MKIIDISQEIFSCAVYPGDPKPERTILLKMEDGAACNLSAFSMCAHNGTHVDAPLHFCSDGKSIDQVDLDRFIGYAYVSEREGPILAADAEEGVYFLHAAPLNLSGAEGGPCRATLVSFDQKEQK